MPKVTQERKFVEDREEWERRRLKWRMNATIAASSHTISDCNADVITGGLFAQAILKWTERKNQSALANMRQRSLTKIAQQMGTGIGRKPLQKWTMDELASVLKYYHKMIDILRNGRLTINFEANRVCVQHSTSIVDHIYNIFHSHSIARERGLSYSIEREKTETRVFDLDRITQAILIHPDASDLLPTEVLPRKSQIAHAGTMGRPEFTEFSRPIYGALDFMYSKTGGASYYGKSFIVLRESLKQYTTLTPIDSFLVKNSDSLTTFSTIEHILPYLQDDFFGYNCFKKLYLRAKELIGAAELVKDSAIPQHIPDFHNPHTRYGQSEVNYIEAHIHKPLYYVNDIAVISIAQHELEQEKNLSLVRNFLQDIRELCAAYEILFVLEP